MSDPSDPSSTPAPSLPGPGTTDPSTPDPGTVDPDHGTTPDGDPIENPSG